MKTKIEPTVARFKLKELRPAEYNPRVISDEALAGLTASIKKFGYIEPIIVNVRANTNTIIGGHQRFRILRKLHKADKSCFGIFSHRPLCNPEKRKLLIIRLSEKGLKCFEQSGRGCS